MRRLECTVCARGKLDLRLKSWLGVQMAGGELDDLEIRQVSKRDSTEVREARVWGHGYAGTDLQHLVRRRVWACDLMIPPNVSTMCGLVPVLAASGGVMGKFEVVLVLLFVCQPRSHIDQGFRC